MAEDSMPWISRHELANAALPVRRETRLQGLGRDPRYPSHGIHPAAQHDDDSPPRAKLSDSYRLSNPTEVPLISRRPIDLSDGIAI